MIQYLVNDPHGGGAGKAILEDLLRIKQMQEEPIPAPRHTKTEQSAGEDEEEF